jgi:hypothetical protein
MTQYAVHVINLIDKFLLPGIFPLTIYRLMILLYAAKLETANKVPTMNDER